MKKHPYPLYVSSLRPFFHPKIGTGDLKIFLKTCLMVGVAHRMANFLLQCKILQVVGVRQQGGNSDHPTLLKKYGTNGHKTIHFGFVTISTIILTSIYTKKMAIKGQELFFKWL